MPIKSKLPIFEHFLSVGNLKPKLKQFFSIELGPWHRDARSALLNLVELDGGGLCRGPPSLNGELHLGGFSAELLRSPLGVEGDELAAGLAVAERAVRVWGGIQYC